MKNKLLITTQFIGIYTREVYKETGFNKLLIKILSKKEVEDFSKKENSILIYRKVSINEYIEEEGQEIDLEEKISSIYTIQKQDSKLIELLKDINITIADEDIEYLQKIGKIFFTDKAYFLKETEYFKEGSKDFVFFIKLFNEFIKYKVENLKDLLEDKELDLK